MQNLKTIISLSFALLLQVSAASQDNKFKLITVLYNEQNVSRCAEYMFCLERNLQHPCIGEIHVLYDDTKDNAKNVLLTYLKSRPVRISYIHGRPSYGDCFDHANTYMPNARVILANADIFFDETLHLLIPYNLTNKFLALTRYDIFTKQAPKRVMYKGSCGEIENIYSQDVWIFMTPLRAFNANARKIQLGVCGCDAAIAACAKAAGLTVLNPCLSLYCYHLHISHVRNYSNKNLPYKKMPQHGVRWTKLDAVS